MNSTEWAKKIVHGAGGFESWERHEVVVFDDRDVGLVEFVLRCLANPECEGSQEALDAITERRRRLDTPGGRVLR